MGSSTRTVTTTSSNSIPQWMSDAGKRTFEFGETIFRQRYQPLQTPTSTPYNQDQQSAFQAVRNNQGAWLNSYNQAKQFAAPDFYNKTVTSSGTSGDTFQQFNRDNLRRYENPYQNMVLDRGLQNIERARQLAQRSVNDKAVMAGAFGGSRHGVANAETNRAYADTAANYIASTLDRGYQQATNQFNRDRSAFQWDQGFNAQNFYRDQDLRARASSLYSDLSRQYQRQLLGDAQQMQAIGDAQWKLAEQDRQGQLAREMEQRDWDKENVERLMALLGASPYSRSARTTQTSPGPNYLMQAVGAGLTALPFLLAPSDRKLKENIRPVKNKLAAFAKLPVSKWDYKPEAAVYGAFGKGHVGPMAQDYAKAFGGSDRFINLQDMLGNLAAAVGEAGRRIERLEKKGAFGRR